MKFADAVVGALLLVACAAMVALGIYVLVGWQGWRAWPAWPVAIVLIGVGLTPLVVMGHRAWNKWRMYPGIRRARLSSWLYQRGWPGLSRLVADDELPF